MAAAEPRMARRSRACMVRMLRSTAPKRLKMIVRGCAFIVNDLSYKGQILYVREKFIREAYVTKNKGLDTQTIIGQVLIRIGSNMSIHPTVKNICVQMSIATTILEYKLHEALVMQYISMVINESASSYMCKLYVRSQPDGNICEIAC